MSEKAPKNPVQKPKKVNSSRVLRGGYWYGDPSNARASYRYRNLPSSRSSGIGFRLTRTKK